MDDMRSELEAKADSPEMDPQKWGKKLEKFKAGLENAAKVQEFVDQNGEGGAKTSDGKVQWSYSRKNFVTSQSTSEGPGHKPFAKWNQDILEEHYQKFKASG